MNKKFGALALFLSLLLALPGSSLVQAQGGLTVLENSAVAEFPLKLHFNLSAESDVNITDIRLHYTVDRDSFADVTSEVYVEFIPATTVDVQWTWDMRRTGGMPTGSTVEYWWTVTDAGGDREETAPVVVNFDDERYPWKSLTEGKVTIYWYRGDLSFAREIMLAAQGALIRLEEDTGAFLKKPVKIYIYADPRDLQGAMIFPQEWTGGVAFSRYGIIAIGISPNNLEWGKRATIHELTHLVVHQMTFNPYGGLPVWLNEGLAMYAEGQLEPGHVALLKNALTEDKLISVRSLASPFSSYAQEANLSYAQSYSLVEFLVRNYGQSQMLEMLNAFSQGSNYDDALTEVYGFDMDGLDALWREYVTRQYQPAPVTTGVSPVIITSSTRLAGKLLPDLWPAVLSLLNGRTGEKVIYNP